MNTTENNATFAIVEVWQPSVILRFLESKNGTLPNGDWKIEKVLQQLHTSNLGNQKWIDVPTELE